jgi:hypothetical protein
MSDHPHGPLTRSRTHAGDARHRPDAHREKSRHDVTVTSKGIKKNITGTLYLLTTS